MAFVHVCMSMYMCTHMHQARSDEMVTINEIVFRYNRWISEVLSYNREFAATILSSCSQISYQPITWQQSNKFRHVDIVKITR